MPRRGPRLENLKSARPHAGVLRSQASLSKPDGRRARLHACPRLSCHRVRSPLCGPSWAIPAQAGSCCLTPDSREGSPPASGSCSEVRRRPVRFRVRTFDVCCWDFPWRRPRRQTKSAVQRWQVAQPLHETGVVSPVSLVIPAVRLACGMDRNTKQSGSTPNEQDRMQRGKNAIEAKV